MGPSCHGPAVLLLCQDAHPSLGDVTERGTFLEPHRQVEKRGQVWKPRKAGSNSLKASTQNGTDFTKFQKYQTKYVGEEIKAQAFLKRSHCVKQFFFFF